jgi:hypothetical protein
MGMKNPDKAEVAMGMKNPDEAGADYNFVDVHNTRPAETKLQVFRELLEHSVWGLEKISNLINYDLCSSA